MADGGVNDNHFDHYLGGAGARTLHELDLDELKFQLKHTTKPHEKERIELLKKLIDEKEKKSKYADGGVTFDEKVKSISKSLEERKKVAPSVQKDYGKTYSKKEAVESAKRIAGAMRKKEMLKKK